MLPPVWVRQSTPEEALWSMARALKERDVSAWSYLSYAQPSLRVDTIAAMPDITRGKGRTILALTQESGARVTQDGDQAVLRGGDGEVVLKRVRGRWFIE
jgi:hypothetical protein